MKRTVVLLLLSSVALAGEPIKFRGAYVGEPLTDFVNCDGKKPHVIKDGYKMHGKLCEGKKGVVWRMHTRGFLNVKDEGEAFVFENRTLVRITISVANEDWEKIRYDLTQKLGEPRSEVPEVYQNGFGARWEYNRGFWSDGSTVAYAGIKVAHIGGEAIRNPFTNQPDTEGIEITITDAEHAKLPSTLPNSLD